MIKIITPTKMMNDKILYNLYFSIFYNLKKYDPTMSCDIFSYGYHENMDEYSYNDDDIYKIIDMILDDNIKMVIFVAPIYYVRKTKHLCIEKDIGKTLLSCDKPIIIVNVDIFDTVYSGVNKKLNELIELSNNIHIFESNKYDYVKEYYEKVPLNQYHEITMMLNDDFMNTQYNNNPINKVQLSGAIDILADNYSLANLYYKERCEFYYIYQSNKDKIEHLTYDKLDKKTDTNNYHNKLNNYIAGFASPVRGLNWLLNKYVEIPCTGSLLLAHRLNKSFLQEYGFYDGINCMLCDNTDYVEKVNYITDPSNRKIIDNIRLNGMNHVRNKFDHNIVGKNIVKEIIKLLKE